MDVNDDDDDDDYDDDDDDYDDDGTRFSGKPKEDMFRSSDLDIHLSVGHDFKCNKNPRVLNTFV